MTKLETYIFLLEKIKNVNTYINISKDINLRGSLAYFVDRYYDEEGWQELLDDIVRLAEDNQVNELCWKLYSLIYVKYEPECINNPGLGKIHILESLKARKYELYNEGDCCDFSLVRVEAFPRFLIQHEFITGD